MLCIHYEGRAICGTYPYEEAERRLRMFSLLLASINTHCNVFLSERINSFHLQLLEIASAAGLL